MPSTEKHLDPIYQDAQWLPTLFLRLGHASFMRSTLKCSKCGAVLRGKSRWDTCASCLTKEARARLCEVGWPSVFAYLRRRGYETQSAKDLTDAVISRQLARGPVEMVGRGEGRLRLHVKSALLDFLSNEASDFLARNQEHVGYLSRPAEVAEIEYQNLPSELTADQVFDQQWAMALSQRVVSAIEAAAAASSRNREWFEILKSYMTGTDEVRWEEPAAQLNTTEGLLKGYVGRLRHHFRNELIREIMETAGRPEDSVNERHAIFEALGYDNRR